MNSIKIISRNSIKRYFSTLNGDVTPLYDFHVKNGGKIVNFGGYLLPVQYADQSIVSSHIFTRKNASIFDVSHMLQTEIKGKNCVEFFEKICTANIKDLKENTGVLTVFTNTNGGILDDLIVTKITDNYLYVVSNAAMKKQDQNIIMKGLEDYKKRSRNNEEIQVKFFETLEKGLIALQGPRAASVLQKFIDIDLTNVYFMNTIVGNVAGVADCRITRCGYTGEDGFEISIPANKSEILVKRLLDNTADVRLAGLGARDSLRLEAGLCLYGSDITTETTPVEAGLTWLIAKRRRELQNFPGAEKILKQIKQGSSRKRVGITSTLGPPPRHGAEIVSYDNHNNHLGEITSGCPSPTLTGTNIAMGYVPIEYSKVGTKLGLKIRNKIYDGVVTKMPFVSAKYYTLKNK